MRKGSVAVGTHVVHPNVSRVDYPGNCGYSVRLQRNGKETNKLFSDAVYGGTRKARLAAIDWREKMVRKLGPALPHSRRAGEPYPPGYSYIKRMLAFYYSGGIRTEYMAWVAFLRIEDKKHLVTKWSIEKWGDEGAREGCEAWLQQKKAELAIRLAKAKTRTKASKPRRELRA